MLFHVLTYWAVVLLSRELGWMWFLMLPWAYSWMTRHLGCSWSLAWCPLVWSTFMLTLWGSSGHFWHSWSKLSMKWGSSFLPFSLEMMWFIVHFNLQMSLLDWNHRIKHSEGRQPDGVTLVPRQQGKCLTWEVTWPDNTFAPSSIGQAAVDSGLFASAAEERKRLKYRVAQMGLFVHTCGSWDIRCIWPRDQIFF